MKQYLDIVKKEIKQHPEPIVLARDILEVLPDRTRDVVIKRFGLHGDDPKTLEGIGKTYGITRERVRQIENSAFTKIKSTGTDQKVYPLVDILEMILREEGGVLSEDRLLKELLEFDIDAELNRRAIRLILSFSDKFIRIKESEKWKEGWTLDKAIFERAQVIIRHFINYFDQEKSIMSEEEAKDVLKNKIAFDHDDDLTNNAVISAIELSKRIGRNPFRKWGKIEWAEISPRGVRDKAYLMMGQINKPLHFREITEKINEISFNGRKAFSQTVHNELIKDDRFILVGRGVYALRDDQAQSDKIKGDIVEILLKANSPMRKSEIIAEILKKYPKIKITSVAISLQDSKIFRKTKENKYTLCPSVKQQ